MTSVLIFTALGLAGATSSTMKADLVRLCALCDRGFSARPRDRIAIDRLVAALEQSPQLTDDLTAGLDGRPVGGKNSPTIVGLWELLYASGADVTSLNANPFLSVGSIFQDIRSPPSIVNCIDFVPRILTAFPASVGSSVDTVFRAKVFATATIQSTTRAGLYFEAVGGQPLTLLGQAVGVELPRLNLPPPFGPPRSSDDGKSQGAGGFFDVSFLDDDMVIIRQNYGGGYFVQTRVMDTDPSIQETKVK